MYLDINDLIAHGLIQNIEERNMSNVDKILQAIEGMEQPVTLKQLQDVTELKPGILSGTLFSLTKQGRLTKEKIEASSKMGPKMRWVYKIVANPQQTS